MRRCTVREGPRLVYVLHGRHDDPRHPSQNEEDAKYRDDDKLDGFVLGEAHERRLVCVSQLQVQPRRHIA
jgi:hypothetical protein